MRPVEEALYRSQLGFTVLQPAMFMQGLTGSWHDAVERGVFAMPYAKDSAMTFVDYRDVAEVAAIAFATDDLVNGTFELAAGGMTTRTEIAALMSRYTGRTVTAEDVAPRERSTAFSPNSPRELVAARAKLPMSRHMRNLAVTASACCVGGLTIHQILGCGHVSPYAGQTVPDVPGVVADVTSSAFYLQDPNPVGGPF